MRGVIIAVLAAAFLLGGCQVRNEDAGAVVGGVLGGVLGSTVGKGDGRVAATIAGALAGAVIGGRIGRKMDAGDQSQAQQTLEDSRTGEPAVWRNPDSGVQYSMTPTRTYSSADGPCREFKTEAWIDGKKETVQGTACRSADGTWQTL